LGQTAINEYMTKRANDKPSNAQWVYDQSWLRYMVAARMRCVCLVRSRWRTNRWGPNRADYKGHIANLLQDHREYYQSVDMYLSAPDLDPVEKARQQRTLRRLRYNGTDISKGDACKARKK